MSKKRRGKPPKLADGQMRYVSVVVSKAAKATSVVRDALAGVLIVEAVNFDATVFDTNDISTIRGSSLSLLSIVDAIADHLIDEAKRIAADRAVHVLVKGASIVELAVATPADKTAEALLTSLEQAARAFLSNIIAFPGAKDDWTSNIDPSRFTIQVATADRSELPRNLPNGSDPLSAMQALARTRIRMAQAQNCTFAMPVEQDLVRWCDFSDCGVHSGFAGVVDDAGDRVSAGVARRRAFGRQARTTMVTNVLAATAEGQKLVDRIIDEGWEFSQSLNMLLPSMSQIKVGGIHPSVAGKIALIHIDGNGFTGKRAMIADPFHLAMFTRQLREIQAIALAALVKAAMDDPAEKVLPVEALLLGGDELVVAVPAWRALDWLAIVQSALAGHQLDPAWMPATATDEDRALSHATGMVFAQVKAPIRHLRDVACTLVDLAKDAPKGRDGFPSAILVIEGFDLPYDGVEGVVRKLYAVERDKPVGSVFAFPGQGAQVGSPVWLAQLHELRSLKQLLPRSQAIRLVQLTHSSLNTPLSTTAQWNSQVDDELMQIYGARKLEEIARLIRSPLLGYAESHPRMPLQQLIMLHDYLGGEAA